VFHEEPTADGDAGDPSPTTTSGTFGDASAPPAVGDAGKVLFYANSDTTLYELDPDDLSAPMVKVGDFDCVGPGKDTSVFTDVAVDKEGSVFGVSPAASWPLALGAPVHCAAKWPLPYDTHFNGLTVAPEGTVAPTEALIGGNATGQLYAIDATSGAPTVVGTLGTDAVTGRPWTVSGDMVFMANQGSPIGFATVRTCTTTTTCTFTDTLVELDVKAIRPGTQSVLKSVRGPIVKGAWCTNPASPQSFGSIFGIVAYRDKVYGFSRKGDFIEIHNDDGSACLVWSDPNVKFAGAGITTVAPVIAPPPK
jgi:hypothetical protein